MNKIGKALLGLISAGSLLMSSSLAQADEDISIEFDGAVAIPLTSPQKERFDVGAAAEIKGHFGIGHWFDLSPVVSVLGLPSADSAVEPGTAVGIGGGVRVKRPHDKENNKGEGFTAVSPWVDANLQYIRTGELNRSGASAAVGASVPTSSDRDIWVGPYVRYLNVFQGERPQYDNRDAKILMLGLSLELSPKAKPVAVVPPPKPVPPPVATPPVQPPPVVVPPPVIPEEKFQLTQKIQFDWDSFKIRDTEVPALEEVVKALAEHTDCKVKIEGHASSEGVVEHNNVLAQRRADAVMKYLVSKGVPAERLSATGFGSRVPVASNATETGRVLNRRAEFVVNFTFVKESK